MRNIANCILCNKSENYIMSNGLCPTCQELAEKRIPLNRNPVVYHRPLVMQLEKAS